MYGIIQDKEERRDKTEPRQQMGLLYAGPEGRRDYIEPRGQMGS
jgi:hypothetical protein